MEDNNPDEERQVSLDEFAMPDDADADRCEAIADYTGERCQHTSLSGIPYCGDHKHLLDDVDVVQYGLKRLKSDG